MPISPISKFLIHKPTKRKKSGEKLMVPDGNVSVRTEKANAKKRFLAKGKLAGVHIFLWLAVVSYLLGGAFIFHTIEGKRNGNTTLEPERRNWTKIGVVLMENMEKFIVPDLMEQNLITSRAELAVIYTYLGNIIGQLENKSIDELDFERIQLDTEIQKQWNFASSVLFAFSIITTIGYGHVAPKTDSGKIFCIFYAIIGIPLTMLAIADLGKFIIEGASLLWRQAKKCVKAKKSKENRENSWGSVVLVLAFLGYVMLTSMLVPFWENLNFLDAVYFSFVTLTTVGLGDIVPQQTNFLLPTLIFLTFGLSLTTMTIEVAADGLKKIHYLGQKLKNVQEAAIWFGGQKLSVAELIGAVGRTYGIPNADLQKINLDRVVESAIESKSTCQGRTPRPPPNTPNHPISPEDFETFRKKPAPFVDSDAAEEEVTKTKKVCLSDLKLQL